MKRSRFSEERIIGVLKEQDGGAKVDEICRRHGISQATFYAWRRDGMDRTSFYDWKRRFELQGLEGLKDLPPVHKSHPQATPPEVVERIVELALAHPAYGCNRYEAMLALKGRRVSAITIQKILNDKELGTRGQHWLALEKQNADHVIELTEEQARFLEKLNP